MTGKGDREGKKKGPSSFFKVAVCLVSGTPVGFHFFFECFSVE